MVQALVNLREPQSEKHDWTCDDRDVVCEFMLKHMCEEELKGRKYCSRLAVVKSLKEGPLPNVCDSAINGQIGRNLKMIRGGIGNYDVWHRIATKGDRVALLFLKLPAAFPLCQECVDILERAQGREVLKDQDHGEFCYGKMRFNVSLGANFHFILETRPGQPRSARLQLLKWAFEVRVVVVGERNRDADVYLDLPAPDEFDAFRTKLGKILSSIWLGQSEVGRTLAS
jgi:hypothetical protein